MKNHPSTLLTLAVLVLPGRGLTASVLENRGAQTWIGLFGSRKVWV